MKMYCLTSPSHNQNQCCFISAVFGTGLRLISKEEVQDPWLKHYWTLHKSFLNTPGNNKLTKHSPLFHNSPTYHYHRRARPKYKVSLTDWQTTYPELIILSSICSDINDANTFHMLNQKIYHYPNKHLFEYCFRRMMAYKIYLKLWSYAQCWLNCTYPIFIPCIENGSEIRAS